MYFLKLNVVEFVNNNYNFRATVANLESKVETLTTSNTLIKEELDMAKNSLTTLKEENQLLKKQLIKEDDLKNVDNFKSFYFLKLQINFY